MRSQIKPQRKLINLHALIIVSFVFILCTLLVVPGPIKALTAATTSNLPPIKTVFLIMMENQDWSSILGNPSAPYINQTLLPLASSANQYYTPPNNHPSLPNYLWLEAGTNFGVSNDGPPSTNHQSSTLHLVTLLKNAGYSWKVYAEGISGTVCPLQNNGLYAVQHNGPVYFDDVTGTNNPNSSYCIAHERPYSELASNLQQNTVANYNYIVPNLCDDMHNSTGCQTTNGIENGDTWLSHLIPQILNSQAYKNGGALFLTWDEGADQANGADGDGPLPFLLISPYAKQGYSNNISYDHSSTLRTIEEIFGLTPLLGDTANATDLADLFLPATLAQDNFHRPNQLHWGRASDGQTWAGDANSLNIFSMKANAGRVAPNSLNSYNAILGPAVTNAEVLFSGTLSSFEHNNLGAVLRWTDAHNWYKALIDGGHLSIVKQVNGTLTQLSSTPFAAAAGTSYTLRFRVVGTALSASVWKTGKSPPGSWMVKAADSARSSGSCGLQMLVHSGVTATITFFQATTQ